MRKLALVSLVLVLACTAQAQYVVAVDTSVSRNADKSLLGSAALSTLLPGSGQRYLGESQRAKPYLWTDLGGWCTILVSWFAGESYLSSAQAYATRYAGVKNPPKDATFLDLMARYRSRSGVAGQNSNPDIAEDHDMAMLRAGKAVDSDYPSDPAHTWDWGPSDNPETTVRMGTYNDMLRNYRLSKIALQVAIGVVVLNRMVSVFDVLRIHRATSSSPLTLDLVPNLAPQASGAELVISF